MRTAPLSGGLALVLALAGPAAAGPSADRSYTATVTQDRAEVRCRPSPSDECYVTNLLRRGERVEVLGDADVPGWLRVRPPAGSFSWVNTRFVHQPNARLLHYVVDAKTPVRIGSGVVDRLPSVVGCEVERGAIVERYTNGGRLGLTRADAAGESGTWLPIVPPPGEVRFLRKDAAAAPALPPPPPEASPATPPGERAYPPQTRAPDPPAPAAGPADPEALWLHAQQADQGGRIPEAIGLYGRVVAETRDKRPDLAKSAMERLNFLTGGGRPPPPPAAEPLAIRGDVPGAVVYGSTPDGRRYRPLTNDAPEPAAPPSVRPAPPASTSEAAAKPQDWSQPAGPAGATPAASGENRQVTGILRTSGRAVGGVTAYALDPAGGDGVRYYVVPRGVDLTPFLGQKVDVYGPAVYKGELRHNYIEALQVRPAP